MSELKERMVQWANKVGALEQKVIDAQKELLAAVKELERDTPSSEGTQVLTEPLPADVTVVLQDESGDYLPFRPPFVIWFCRGNRIMCKQVCDEYGNFWRINPREENN